MGENTRANLFGSSYLENFKAGRKRDARVDCRQCESL